MISAGNDIIALNIVNSKRSNQEKFYSKILSLSEIDLYFNDISVSMSFEKFVWLLWSIKESAYKYLKRSIPQLIFSPTKIIVQTIVCPSYGTKLNFKQGAKEKTSFSENEFYKATICFLSHNLFARSEIHNELIHTVVNGKRNFDNISWGIKYIAHTDYEDQANEVRSFILKRFKFIYTQDDLQIRKSPLGYPLLLRGKKETDIPISFSHHDHYIAYSFYLEDGSVS
jgi:phosphopantetheinyl transferase (holo-ACP synthase)